MKGAPPGRASESPRPTSGPGAVAPAPTVSDGALARLRALALSSAAMLLAADARPVAGARPAVATRTLNPLPPILLLTSPPPLTPRQQTPQLPPVAARSTWTLPAEE
jgi:hypothetical protein